MTSKKHYKQIAEAINVYIRKVDEREAWTERRETARLIANDLADIFEQDNPNFRRGIFLAACGMVGYPDN